MRRLTVAVVLGLLVLTGLSALPPDRAQAHALLVRSDPVVDAKLAEPPATVTAWFSESLDRSLSTMHVLDGTGKTVDVDAVTFADDDRTMMRQGIQDGLPPGFYVVVWETLSAVDGHFIKGSFPFTVLNADGSEPSGPRPEVAGVSGGGRPAVDRTLTRLAGLVGAAGLVGGLGFVLLVVAGASAEAPGEWRRRIREAGRRHALWTVWAAIAVLAVAGLAEVIVQARQLGGLDLVNKVVSDTEWGQRWVQRQVVLVTIAVTVAAGMAWGHTREALARVALWAALAGAFLYLLLVSLVSHGGAVQGSFWAVTADFVHLSAAAVWIGMLAQLGLLLAWARRDAPESVRTPLIAGHLQRFSVIAAISVMALLTTGTFSALTEVPTWKALVDTSYGRVLLAKLALIGLLLPVAALNAVVLRPRAVRQAASSGREALDRLRRWLTRAVWLEAALAVGILAIVGVLTQYPTARVTVESQEFVQESAQAVVGFESTSQAGDLGVNISVSPNTAGTNSYQVYLFPQPGQPLAKVLQVRLRFRPPDPALGPSETIADEVNANFFKAAGAFFTSSGDWEVQVFVRRAALDDVSTFFRVPVQAAGVQAGGRDRFALPLVTGSWSLVAAIGLMLAAAMVWVPAQQWPRIRVRPARWLRMTAITLGVVGLGLLLGVHQHIGLTPEQARQGNPVAATDASIARGREVYDQNCTQCHGLTGRGDGPLAKSLAVPPVDFNQHIPYHTDLFFFSVITRGFGNIMPAFASQISEEDRWNLINFLRAEHSLDSQKK
ncbi:MAG: CopD family protein [Dehalococcoidia bacterium]|nr:CopD family protein [Dehalococcoidia bacterium]